MRLVRRKVKKVSDSFHRLVETIKAWWKLTNFGGNYV
jgi:hypothetical protein